MMPHVDVPQSRSLGIRDRSVWLVLFFVMSRWHARGSRPPRERNSS